jgi:CheY-like chemotaxis protein
MDGFEFIDAYAAIHPELREKTRLIMVSASLSPDDEQRANEHEEVNGFIQKPIDIQVLQRILTENSPADKQGPCAP